MRSTLAPTRPAISAILTILAAFTVVMLTACGGGGSSSLSTNEGTTGGETATSPIVNETAPEGSGVGGAQPESPSCDGTVCAPEEHCEIVQVQCIRAPCPPLPMCRPN